MKQTIVLKLETTPIEYSSLLETMEAFNRACNYVAEIACTRHIANKIALQPIVYGHLRSHFKLSAQMAIRAIAKACEACKRHEFTHLSFDLHGAMVFDERIMRFHGTDCVALTTHNGRQQFALSYGEYQAARLAMRKGQADLIRHQPAQHGIEEPTRRTAILGIPAAAGLHRLQVRGGRRSACAGRSRLYQPDVPCLPALRKSQPPFAI